MAFDWWTLALQTINFAILVWLLHRFLYQPVLRQIDARRIALEQEQADAASATAEAEAERATMVDERRGIADERTAALKSAAAEAEKAAAERRAKAEHEVEVLITETRQQLVAERDAAKIEIRQAALELGARMARRLLEEVPAALRTEAWLERIEAHLKDVAAEQRAELINGLQNGASLHVVTAEALPEPAMKEWRQRLDQALGDHATITFSADPSLVAGADLHFPSAILRFSWQDTLAVMQAEIASHGNAG